MRHVESVVPLDDEPAPAPMRMGSEYSDAATYLRRTARAGATPRRQSSEDPGHGSNDSDFGQAPRHE